MVAKELISFVPAYNIMLMSWLSSLRYKTRYAYAYVDQDQALHNFTNLKEKFHQTKIFQ